MSGNRGGAPVLRVLRADGGGGGGAEVPGGEDAHQRGHLQTGQECAGALDRGGGAHKVRLLL